MAHINEFLASDEFAPFTSHLTSLFLEGSRLCQILRIIKEESGAKRTLHGSLLHHGPIELLSAKIERLLVVPGPKIRNVPKLDSFLLFGRFFSSTFPVGVKILYKRKNTVQNGIE